MAWIPCACILAIKQNPWMNLIYFVFSHLPLITGTTMTTATAAAPINKRIYVKTLYTVSGWCLLNFGNGAVDGGAQSIMNFCTSVYETIFFLSFVERFCSGYFWVWLLYGDGSSFAHYLFTNSSLSHRIKFFSPHKHTYKIHTARQAQWYKAMWPMCMYLRPMIC